ncbi:HlyD family type I secretion periplasmic adaptor subunit [Nitratireductor kimnyeongensis]|uniref:Membrane fusion protein (MFP) family protein n=1 Tax=Nitratireductor kimnyeongensis TaxID=430679 RepID=A0ABW0TBE9_9HYPH|nr:HlyD family type I secretion periplasmic adaptor subunit [Nitratireductor kimnyeongensis]QZZ35516.1 HlyD family type I secretion periplasmic adaptor subunit [Nitratireductor kimnyeongensis]
MRLFDTSGAASPTLHLTVLVSTAIFMTSLVAACVLRVEVTARGSVRIVPLDRVQVVQAEYPGSITSILVRDGVGVRKGELLLTLDTTSAETKLLAVVEEEARLKRDNVRIAAFLSALVELRDGGGARNGAEESLPIVTGEVGDEAMQARLLEAELKDFADGLAGADARLDVNRKALDVLQGRVARADTALIVQQERLEAAEKLMDRGISSREAYLKVRAAYDDLQSEREVVAREIAKTRAEASVLNAQRAGLFSANYNRAMQKRDKIDARLAALRQDRRALEERVAATQLRSPMSGTVEQLAVTTVGGVVQAGQDLMRVVPNDSQLEFEALFSNEDSGFLRTGQKARIRLDAYPAERFGTMMATVTDIASDSIEVGGSGRWGFVVRLRPEDDALQSSAGRLALRPGMTGSVDAITGDRRLISYFLAPITAQFSQSLGER